MAWPGQGMYALLNPTVLIDKYDPEELMPLWPIKYSEARPANGNLLYTTPAWGLREADTTRKCIFQIFPEYISAKADNWTHFH